MVYLSFSFNKHSNFVVTSNNLLEVCKSRILKGRDNSQRKFNIQDQDKKNPYFRIQIVSEKVYSGSRAR